MVVLNPVPLHISRELMWGAWSCLTEFEEFSRDGESIFLLSWGPYKLKRHSFHFSKWSWMPTEIYNPLSTEPTTREFSYGGSSCTLGVILNLDCQVVDLESLWK